MRNWKMGLFAAPLALALVACPGPTGPTITSSSPIEGATGVDPSATITITFSATLGGTPSFTASPTFAAPAPTVSGNTLTIKPSSALTANTKYTISLSGIQDASGNGTSGLALSFTTAAVVKNDIQSTASRDGTIFKETVGNYKSAATNDTARVGQTAGATVDGVAKGFFSFALPAGLTATKVKTATLKLVRTPNAAEGANGNAGFDLGDVRLDLINFGTKNLTDLKIDNPSAVPPTTADPELKAAYDATGELPITIKSNTDLSKLDVTALVKQAITAGRAVVDLRLSIPGTPNTGATGKWLRFGVFENSDATKRPVLSIEQN